ncbi:hypothetical protein SAMN05428966_11271 [Massilia sp. PDC64]|nr:DUF2076 family protein [Massilia sp. PDC64]SDF03339.1 hypothetical protein SAMN05428966_11271 [Massilia sp. PDC64]
MSPQDSQMLHDFLSQLIQARGIQKDPEADALIQRAVAQQPDAAYLLVQRALLLEQALNNAKDRIASLENQVRSGQQGGDGGKFLDANSWGNSGRTQPAQSYQRDTQQPYQSQPQYQPPYQPQYQPQYQSAPSSGFLRGGFGSTLGSIAATAAGVAAGGFLFQGLENMFSHHDHGGGNRLLNSDDPANNLFSDQSGSSLADQAGLGDVDRVLDNGSSESLFDSSVDNGSLDGGQGFFDGDGSDEGLFS